ncbi:stearoyl-CoA 9-desaturase [Corynebacterium falsenii DSM 44353]|uniref:flavin reductase family protein n=1 Tax=Corynebacterium falsenii TaxID=108486 RepID=UPI0003E9413D|nr:iron-sulfur cluster-binding domain-containing protein [Corynebacterium falsenii]AHI03600.1 stearoyl-CoA 9-desaturase [Corynebacterium falsenii DSM 44353]UBI04322.1 iron-sulfur cluster-binding domain-containing protein [Corynebacterium falsenii]
MIRSSIQHATRRLARLLTFPHFPSDYANLVNPLHGRELRGRVVDVSRHPDHAEVTLQPGPGMVTDFHPGQFIGLGVRVNGRWVWRCYSLTNAPAPAGTRHDSNPGGSNHSTGALLTIGIKPVPDGAVSSHISHTMRPGDIIRLTQPGGDFYLPTPLPHSIAFITAGAGITPVISMIRWLAQEHPTGRAQLPDIIHVHSDSRGTIPAPYQRELTDLAAEHRGYTLLPWNSSERGRLTPDRLRDLIPDITSRERLACGPQPFLDAITAALPGTRTECFHSELAAGATDGGTVTLEGTNRTFECSGSTSILEAAEAAGYALPHGCRMGICHTCTAHIVDGSVTDLRSGHVHGAGENVRACSTTPQGAVTVREAPA